MISLPTNRRNALFAGVLLSAFAVVTAGCGRPPDEAWLRFLGFSESESAATTLTVIEGKLQDNTALTADANFQNRSLNVGQTGGTGILVNRARVDYRMAGYSPPPTEYNFVLYLAPPDDGQADTGTLTGFPLAPVSLKHWLINSGVSAAVVEITAQVTFFAETDEGTKIETEGSIGIALTNSN